MSFISVGKMQKIFRTQFFYWFYPLKSIVFRKINRQIYLSVGFYLFRGYPPEGDNHNRAVCWKSKKGLSNHTNCDIICMLHKCIKLFFIGKITFVKRCFLSYSFLWKIGRALCSNNRGTALFWCVPRLGHTFFIF